MSRDFEGLDFRKTELDDLTLSRRRLAVLDGVKVFEAKLGEAFPISVLFHERWPWQIWGWPIPAQARWMCGNLGLGCTAVTMLKHEFGARW